jgi:hypothetical protein
MKYKLNEFVSIHSGYTFRSGVSVSVAGSYSVIQMKDLATNGLVDCLNLARVEPGNFSEEHYALKDDLIFRSRGVSISSVILEQSLERCVVAAPLYKIRIKDKGRILPEYLNWYLGQGAAQDYFQRRATGTGSLMVSKQNLGLLEVVVPQMKKQKLIVDIVNLSRSQSELSERIESLRIKHVSSILAECIKGE